MYGSPAYKFVIKNWHKKAKSIFHFLFCFVILYHSLPFSRAYVNNCYLNCIFEQKESFRQIHVKGRFALMVYIRLTASIMNVYEHEYKLESSCSHSILKQLFSGHIKQKNVSRKQ